MILTAAKAALALALALQSQGAPPTPRPAFCPANYCTCGCAAGGQCLCKAPAKSLPKPATKPAAPAPTKTPPKGTPAKAKFDPARVRKASVQTTLTLNGTLINGSGTVFRIEPKQWYVLTCAHNACRGGNTANGIEHQGLTVTDHTGTVHPARVLAYDLEADVLVLAIAGKAPVQAVTVAQSEPYRAGTPVVKAGFSKGGPLRTERGKATGTVEYRGHDLSNPNLLLDIDSQYGDSGGGVFRVADGALIGVTRAGPPGYGGLRAVRLPRIQAVIRRALAPRAAPVPVHAAPGYAAPARVAPAPIRRMAAPCPTCPT